MKSRIISIAIATVVIGIITACFGATQPEPEVESTPTAIVTPVTDEMVIEYYGDTAEELESLFEG